MKYLPKISIIIPTRNEKLVIGRRLERFASLDYPRSKMEIVIVDGMSNDGTGEICLEYASEHPDFIQVFD